MHVIGTSRDPKASPQGRLTTRGTNHLDLDKTLRRHRTKALAAEVSEDRVRSWYRASDPVAGLEETEFGATVSPQAVLATVLTDLRWADETGRAAERVD